MPRSRADAIVLGAGAAGLSAARELTAAGLEVVVLEARGRVGGRIHSVHDAAVARPIELGAEFVHGRSPDLFELFSAAGVVPEELPDDHLRSTEGRLSPVDDFWGKIEALGRDLARWLGRRDRPLSEYLSRARLPARTRALLEEFVEGFYAARLDRISARSLASGGDGLQRQFRPAGGYGPAIRWMRDSLDPRRAEVRLGTRATAVRWSRGDVVVEAVGPSGRALEPFRARAAVVTLPHALLRSNALPFAPALDGRRGALERLETGHVFKIVMRFRVSFWDDDAFIRRRLSRKVDDPAPLNFVHGEAPVPVWWTSLPARLPLWTGWAGGPNAERILSADPTARVDRALDALSTLLGVPRRTLDDGLDGTWAHDWRADPFSKGAYTYAGVGGLTAQKALARPVEGTLFFAGEALSSQVGTVPGALDSGRRAGRAAAERLGA